MGVAPLLVRFTFGLRFWMRRMKLCLSPGGLWVMVPQFRVITIGMSNHIANHHGDTRGIDSIAAKKPKAFLHSTRKTCLASEKLWPLLVMVTAACPETLKLPTTNG